MIVLVVEDLTELREVIGRVLMANGYTVLAAPDAETAISLVSSTAQSIDLLVTDWHLPGMNGCDLAKHLIATHPQMRVLICSGDVDYENEDGRWLKGLGEYIAKPYDLMAMLEKLQKLSARPPSTP